MEPSRRKSSKHKHKKKKSKHATSDKHADVERIKDKKKSKKKSKHKDSHSEEETVGPVMNSVSGTAATGVESQAKGPMTKEMWEKQQNVVRRVYDTDTGRSRYCLDISG